VWTLFKNGVNARSEAGRLNSPNKLIKIGDINVKNDLAGGWIPAADDAAPYWECHFFETGQGEFLAEVKGRA